jgi:hypothetical protein
MSDSLQNLVLISLSLEFSGRPRSARRDSLRFIPTLSGL